MWVIGPLWHEILLADPIPRNSHHSGPILSANLSVSKEGLPLVLIMLLVFLFIGLSFERPYLMMTGLIPHVCKFHQIHNKFNSNEICRF